MDKLIVISVLTLFILVVFSISLLTYFNWEFFIDKRRVDVNTTVVFYNAEPANPTTLVPSGKEISLYFGLISY